MHSAVPKIINLAGMCQKGRRDLEVEVGGERREKGKGRGGKYKEVSI